MKRDTMDEWDPVKGNINCLEILYDFWYAFLKRKEESWDDGENIVAIVC